MHTKCCFEINRNPFILNNLLRITRVSRKRPEGLTVTSNNVFWTPIPSQAHDMHTIYNVFWPKTAFVQQDQARDCRVPYIQRTMRGDDI